MKRRGLPIILALWVFIPLLWAHKSEKKSDAKVIDAGSFGIFKDGRRIATETFWVTQQPEMSVAASEIKTDDGGAAMDQSSELELGADGNLKEYTWHEVKPEKAEVTLLPGDQIMTERMERTGGKPQNRPFILPASTSVLDDYFFVHREILAWKYMATYCGASFTSCNLPKASMGVVIPQEQISSLVSLEYKGQEKVMIRGVEQDLSRFNLKSDDSEWAMWLDGQRKLVKIQIPAEQTEVVRD